MNFNPIDIVIILFLFLNLYFGYKNGFLKELKKNVSIIISIILSSLIITNLSNQFYFLKKYCVSQIRTEQSFLTNRQTHTQYFGTRIFILLIFYI